MATSGAQQDGSTITITVPVDQLTTVIQEAVAAAVTSTLQATAKSKGSGKTHARETKLPDGQTKVLDVQRQMTVDLRDPRSQGLGPCGISHAKSLRGGNQWGKWSFCGKCGLRTSYIPFKDAPPQETHVDNAANVTEALSRLKDSSGEFPAGISGRDVKQAISAVAAEKKMARGGASRRASKTPPDDVEQSSTGTPQPPTMPGQTSEATRSESPASRVTTEDGSEDDGSFVLLASQAERHQSGSSEL